MCLTTMFTSGILHERGSHTRASGSGVRRPARLERVMARPNSAKLRVRATTWMKPAPWEVVEHDKAPQLGI